MSKPVRPKTHSRPGYRPCRESCQHDYHREGHIGLCIVYRCSKCGDEYEKDVS